MAAFTCIFKDLKQNKEEGINKPNQLEALRPTWDRCDLSTDSQMEWR